MTETVDYTCMIVVEGTSHLLRGVLLHTTYLNVNLHEDNTNEV